MCLLICEISRHVHILYQETTGVHYLKLNAGTLTGYLKKKMPRENQRLDVDQLQSPDSPQKCIGSHMVVDWVDIILK